VGVHTHASLSGQTGDFLEEPDYDALECAHALGPVLYYVSRARLSPRNGMLNVCTKLASLMRNYGGTFVDGTPLRNRPCTALETADCAIPQVTQDNPNQVLFMGSDFQAGVNLQQYRTLVLYQMDVAGERLLDPVDIEQWIGLIHRTGQTQNCRIVTVLTAYMKFSKKMDRDFLRWYYCLLSDPEGLDLFGDNTPDVAFLQPVIADYARKMLRANTTDSRSEENKKREEFNKSLDTLRFAALMELIYFGTEYDDDRARRSTRAGEIISHIRAVCNKHEGFGKPKRA
jgi:hypothetical protein